jgi:hypothetical protein
MPLPSLLLLLLPLLLPSLLSLWCHCCLPLFVVAAVAIVAAVVVATVTPMLLLLPLLWVEGDMDMVVVVGEIAKRRDQARTLNLVSTSPGHPNGGGESNGDSGHERCENEWVEDVVVMEWAGNERGWYWW